MAFKDKAKKAGGQVPYGTDYLTHSKQFVYLRQPIRSTLKGNWIYVEGAKGRKLVNAPLVAWEDRRVPLQIIVPLLARSSSPKLSQGPVDILLEDIDDGIISKEVITPIIKEDPEPLRNPLTPPYKKPPTPRPSSPKKADLTLLPKKSQGAPLGNPK